MVRRAHRVWVVAGIGCLLLTAFGCTVCRHAKRTLLDEPAEFSAKHDRTRSIKTYREWAEQEWQRCAGNCGAGVNNDEFGAGFRDGFVDFVFAGGTGTPPPVPPRKFWNVAHRNAHGHAASMDWFAGYQLGASVARDGGYRDQAIVLSSYEFSDALPGGYAPDPGAGLAYPRPAEPIIGVPFDESLVDPVLEPPAAEVAPDSVPGESLPEPSLPPEGTSPPVPEAPVPDVDDYEAGVLPPITPRTAESPEFSSAESQSPLPRIKTTATTRASRIQLLK